MARSKSLLTTQAAGIVLQLSAEFVEFLGQNVIKKIDWRVVDTDECDSSIEPEPETFVIRI